jgi:hypothetical protein
MDLMNVTIGNLTFDHSTYDADGDVLYLHIGERQAAADSEQTPEGHVLRVERCRARHRPDDHQRPLAAGA